MAEVSYNSRLVSMEIAGVAPVPISSDFITVRDGRNRSMIFSIGTDNIFRVILDDPDLTRCLVDLNTVLGLEDSEIVTAYDVRQALDSTIYLAIAIGRNNDPSWSQLLILKPFKPSEVNFFSQETVRDLVIPQTVTLKSPVRKILVGQKDDLEPYPLIVIAYHDTSQFTEEEYIARIQVDRDLGSWSLAADLNLPANADKLLDFYPATVTGARGIFVLYEVMGIRSIVFTAYSRSQDCGVRCPPNATRLMTFTNASGKDDLIVAGDGLWHVRSSSLGRSNARCKKLVDTPAFTNIKDLDVSRVDVNTKLALSIWVTNSRNAISYLKFEDLDITGMDTPEPVEVIPEGQGGYFSSFMDERGNQSLVYANEDRDLVLLEQAVETGIWNNIPFIVRTACQSYEMVPSYLCTVSITDSKLHLPVSNASVHINSASWVTLSANGMTYSITPGGIQLEADNAGEIAFVIPTTDISSTLLTINSIKDPDGAVLELTGGPFRIDPSHYTLKELGNIRTADELKSARTAFGEPVFAGSNITDEDFDSAASAFKTLQERHMELTTGAGQAMRITTLTVEEVTWLPWSWFHWIERQATRVVRWVVECIESAWTFVVKIGKQVYNFVLDTLDAVKKTMSWVWNDLIKKPFKDMIDWLGFTLEREWKAILATSELVKGMINATLDFGSTQLWEVAGSVDEVFNNLKDKMHKSLDSAAAISKRDSNLNNPKQKKDPTIVDTGLDWIRYQIKQNTKSLKDQAGAKTTKTEEVKGVTAVVALWHELLKPFLDEMTGTFLNLIESLLSLFETNRTVSFKDILEQIHADLLIGIVSSLQRIVVGVVKVLGHILDDIKTILNEPFPLTGIFGILLSCLGIKLPSLLEIVSFVIAIPTTLIRKIAGGGNARGLPKKFNSTEIRQSLEGTLKAQDIKRHREICRFTSDVGVAIVPLSGLVDLGNIAISTFTAGSGLAGPAKLRKIGGTGTLLVKAFASLAAWPRDPTIPGCGARKAIALLGASTAIVEVLISWFITSPGKLKAAACVELATVLITIALLPMVYEAEVDATEAEFPGKSETVSNLVFIGRIFGCLGKVAANGAVILVDPVSIATATGMSGMFNTAGGLFLMSGSSQSLENHAWEAPI